MKSAKFASIVKKHVLPSMNGWVIHKNQLIWRTTREVIVFVLCDSSAWSKENFYVEACVVCLYDRDTQESLNLDIGGRLPYNMKKYGSTVWTYTGDNEAEIGKRLLTLIEAEALPFFRKLQTPELLLANHPRRLIVDEALAGPRDPDMNALDVLARTAAVVGEWKLAKTYMDAWVELTRLDLEDSETRGIESPDWQVELLATNREYARLMKTDRDDLLRRLNEQVARAEAAHKLPPPQGIMLPGA